MSPSVCLLHIGHDSLLATARREVLSRVGYQVHLARSRRRAINAMNQLGFRAALICHSIPADEAEELALELRQMDPYMRIIRLHTGDPIDGELFYDGLVNALRGPDVLQTSVACVIASKPASSGRIAS